MRGTTLCLFFGSIATVAGQPLCSTWVFYCNHQDLDERHGFYSPTSPAWQLDGKSAIGVERKYQRKRIFPPLGPNTFTERCHESRVFIQPVPAPNGEKSRTFLTNWAEGIPTSVQDLGEEVLIEVTEGDNSRCKEEDIEHDPLAPIPDNIWFKVPKDGSKAITELFRYPAWSGSPSPLDDKQLVASPDGKHAVLYSCEDHVRESCGPGCWTSGAKAIGKFPCEVHVISTDTPVNGGLAPVQHNITVMLEENYAFSSLQHYGVFRQYSTSTKPYFLVSDWVNYSWAIDLESGKVSQVAVEAECHLSPPTLSTYKSPDGFNLQPSSSGKLYFEAVYGGSGHKTFGCGETSELAERLGIDSTVDGRVAVPLAFAGGMASFGLGLVAYRKYRESKKDTKELVATLELGERKASL